MSVLYQTPTFQDDPGARDHEHVYCISGVGQLSASRLWQTYAYQLKARAIFTILEKRFYNLGFGGNIRDLTDKPGCPLPHWT